VLYAPGTIIHLTYARQQVWWNKLIIMIGYVDLDSGIDEYQDQFRHSVTIGDLLNVVRARKIVLRRLFALLP